ncbi:MAG TPA: hypothetical protein VEC99_09670, partial [Clostridia bacterium]|nr:hypothetical protein [Clostridia bacterium]
MQRTFSCSNAISKFSRYRVLASLLWAVMALALPERLHAGGSVTAWGANGSTTFPTELRNIKAVAVGFHHSLAVRADGGITAWIDPRYSSLSYLVEMPVGLSNVTAVACGYYHNVALKADGT